MRSIPRPRTGRFISGPSTPISAAGLLSGVSTGFVFATWRTLSGTSTGATFEYRIDGVLVYTQATAAGEDLRDVMIQGCNFGEAGSYSVYWDNIAASAIPEPAATVLGAGVLALGLVFWRRRTVNE